MQTSGGELVEQFYFTRAAGKNDVRSGAAPKPDIEFTLTPLAAEQILNDPTQEIGAIGVNLLKLITSPDANFRISLKTKIGFFDLFSKGYLGVIATGGQQFAGQLAALGLSGISAIKDVLKNLRN